ncbi:hypothetical protein PRN20_13965 [Devosia sp. ZB163]|uniref:hypothetical protein n=1 Tax=Devosia sp. ZB163 TaxID=3025938 RepID=UPI00235F7691|nr:hypothetical protein [Devosia sp. ZB163]MDC9824837.1 hypothetical protein [Devosia sp. ZB163]
MTTKDQAPTDLIRSWQLPYAARLGSSVRSKGVYLEARARLPKSARKALSVSAGDLTLRMAEGSATEFEDAARIVEKTLTGIEDLPVIPREIEDILSISTTERHRWLKDGRLPSAGTRTVKLPGRAKKITFHVFDPRMVEDLLDRAVVDAWREEDAERAAENRRKAAWKAQLTRSTKKTAAVANSTEALEDDDRFKLRGWAEFEREGPR